MKATYTSAAQSLLREQGYLIDSTMFWGDWLETREMREQSMDRTTLTTSEIERLRKEHGSFTPNIQRAEKVKAVMLKKPEISVRELAKEIGEGATQVSKDMRAFRD